MVPLKTKEVFRDIPHHRAKMPIMKANGAA